MILTEHLADDAGTLLVRLVAEVSDTAHTEEDAAVNRLETVTDIREGTRHNHRHGIVDVGAFHLLLDVDLHDSVLINCLIFVHYLFYCYRFSDVKTGSFKTG